MSKLLMRLIVVTTMVAASLVLPHAAAADRLGRTGCTSDNGSDVQAHFGVEGSDVIWLNLQGHHPPCVTVVRGNTFYRAHGWTAQLPPGTQVGGETIETVYPEGYRPARRAPMKDFLSKIVRARYVVSRDGRVEAARTVERRELLERAKLGEFGDLFVAPDSSSGVTVHAEAPEWTTLEPFSSRRLGAGEHTFAIYWTLTDRHCDGFGADSTANCIPAGESLSTTTVFDVVPHPR